MADFVAGCFQVVAADDKYGVGKDDVIGRALRAKHIMNVVECEDANENTPISEAASKELSDLTLLLNIEMTHEYLQKASHFSYRILKYIKISINFL